MNSKTQHSTSIQGTDLPSLAEQIVHVCFYLALILSLLSGVFAWHIEVLEYVWERNAAEEGTKLLAKAVRSGSKFWIISFLIPSVFFTCIGLEVLVWSVGMIVVGALVTFGMCYGGWQVYRILLRARDARVTFKSPS